MSQIVVVFDVNPDCPRRVAAQTLCDALVAAQITRLDTPLDGQPIESWWYADRDLKDIDRNDNGAFELVHAEDSGR